MRNSIIHNNGIQYLAFKVQCNHQLKFTFLHRLANPQGEKSNPHSIKDKWELFILLCCCCRPTLHLELMAVWASLAEQWLFHCCHFYKINTIMYLKLINSRGRYLALAKRHSYLTCIWEVQVLVRGWCIFRMQFFITAVDGGATSHLFYTSYLFTVAPATGQWQQWEDGLEWSCKSDQYKINM